MVMAFSCAMAQRFTDQLDRGVVATVKGDSVFVSWRILANEYYNTTYSLYKNDSETPIATGLTKSNITVKGTINDTFSVRATINGVAGVKSSAVKPWSRFGATDAGFMDIPLEPIYDRSLVPVDVTHHYWPNDAIFADLDGDGQLDVIVKRINVWETNYYDKNDTIHFALGSKTADIYPIESKEFVVWDAYRVDWANKTATRLWWLDCGPNMVSLNSTENNLLAYDWDMDGKAEVVMRGADNMILHKADGSTTTFGRSDVNTRGDFNHSAGGQYAWTFTGDEYLLYLNGLSGEPYQIMTYPLPRYENGETDINAAWPGSKSYGHISSKYYMGAPYLDGRRPSLFLARGIYSRHKMVALDIDTNHNITQRWRWDSQTNGNTPGSYWYGSGYHNYIIADVDEDGRDEIVYGSMIIDDNGQGLNSTKYGHGDAQHVSDFDPYRKGLELFSCIEDYPEWGMAYRSGLTGEVYTKFQSWPVKQGDHDDGRCLAGNFTNDYPGSVGQSWLSQPLMLTKNVYNDALNELFVAKSKSLNFRIYWDGDLLSELFDGTGANGWGSTGTVAEWTGSQSNRIFTTDAVTNNDSKNNPCFQGDILGDWREELVMRLCTGTETVDNVKYTRCDALRVYTSIIPTDYPIYSLWEDHQYRQAMGTQMQVYNLPPNPSFFLGQLEGITVPPPPLTNIGREEVANGGTINTALNGKHVMMAAVGDAQATVAEGASPMVFTDNAPWWLQGQNPSLSSTSSVIAPIAQVYTHTLTGAAFTGATQVAKQGGGVLVLPAKTQEYTGDTKVWAGTLQFDGVMTASHVWLNRFAALRSTGGSFANVTAEYGADLQPGGEDFNVSTMTVEDLSLNFGAQVTFDIAGLEVGDNDQLKTTTLHLISKNDEELWMNYGPEHLAPVFSFRYETTPDAGRYPIGTVGTLDGDLSEVVIEGINEAQEPELLIENGVLYLVIGSAQLAPEVEIAIVDMVPVTADFHQLYPSTEGYGYYLPQVGINVKGETTENPVLVGTFTALDGTVTEVGSTASTSFYSNDYENATDASAWTNGEGTLELVNSDATYGKYIHHNNTSTKGNRSMYTLFNADYGTTPPESYLVEFDACITAGTNASCVSDLVVMSNGCVVPTDKNIGIEWTGANEAGKGYLFRMRASGANSQTFTINDGTATVTLDKTKWYHYAITVDVENSTAAYVITQNNTQVTNGTFNVPSGTSCLAMGIFMLDGRSYGDSKFDNIRVGVPATGMSSFTFTEPGTLKVTSSLEGYADNVVTYKVEHPYFVSYETVDYDQLTDMNDVVSQLGWNASNTTSSEWRWANWDRSSNKTIVSSDNTAAGPVDKDGVVNISRGNNYTPLCVMIGEGLGHNYDNSANNATTTFSANGLGGESTVVYSKWNALREYGERYERYDLASEDGGWSYTTAPGWANITLCKVKVFNPVAINDELASLQPMAITNGYAHLWRKGLQTGSTWATLVLPFSLDATAVRAAFGENTEVANLTNDGDATQVVLETESGAIAANEPFLIRKIDGQLPQPFSFSGVNSNPVATPMVSCDDFQFIGNYDNKGSVSFNKTDYFYMTSGLSTVAEDNTMMTLKGYRAFFRLTSGNGGNAIAVSFDGTTTVGDFIYNTTAPCNIYNMAGQLVRSNATSLKGLPKGVYLMRGKAVVVK